MASDRAIPVRPSRLRPQAGVASLNPKFTGMVRTLAADGQLFAYQYAIFLVGCSFGYFNGTDLIRFGLHLPIPEFIVVLPTLIFF